jgi:hypothetical protein
MNPLDVTSTSLGIGAVNADDAISEGRADQLSSRLAWFDSRNAQSPKLDHGHSLPRSVFRGDSARVTVLPSGFLWRILEFGIHGTAVPLSAPM